MPRVNDAARHAVVDPDQQEVRESRSAPHQQSDASPYDPDIPGSRISKTALGCSTVPIFFIFLKSPGEARNMATLQSDKISGP
jgi:hypothetical protein